MGIYSSYITESMLPINEAQLENNINSILENIECLSESDFEVINEGHNFDAYKISRKCIKEYKAEIKAYKKAKKDNDYKEAFKHLENAKEKINESIEEIKNIEWNGKDAVIAELYTVAISFASFSLVMFGGSFIGNIGRYSTKSALNLALSKVKVYSKYLLGGAGLTFTGFLQILNAIIVIMSDLIKGYKSYKEGQSGAEAFNSSRRSILKNMNNLSSNINAFEKALEKEVKKNGGDIKSIKTDISSEDKDNEE